MTLDRHTTTAYRLILAGTTIALLCGLVSAEGRSPDAASSRAGLIPPLQSLAKRAASTVPSLSLQDRGLPLTPQMFGAACDSDGTPGNGADDSDALQAAIDLGEATGQTVKIVGEPTVQHAPRMCRTTKPLVIAAHVTIDGESCQPYTDSAASQPTPGAGSWLFFDHPGKGVMLPDRGATPMPSGVMIRNLCTMRAQPAFVSSGAWTPNAAFDFDFDVEKDDTTLDNILMLNPTRGIRTSAKVTIHDLRGDPYLVGIDMVNDEDVARIDQVHFWDFSGINAAKSAYKRANMTALRIGRADNPQISNVFAISPRLCIHLVKNAAGVANKIHASNIDCDLVGNLGLLSEAPGATGQFANFTVQGADPEDGTSTTASRSAININATDNRFAFANFRATNLGGSAIYAKGRGNWLDFSGLFVENWGLGETAATPAIDAEAGSTINLDATPLFQPGSVSRALYSNGSAGTINKATSSKVN